MLLGIAPFKAIHKGAISFDDTEHLTTHEYEMGQGKDQLSTSLEPNHTHFILVDGGFGDEIPTRNLIEEALCRDKSEDEDAQPQEVSTALPPPPLPLSPPPSAMP